MWTRTAAVALTAAVLTAACSGADEQASSTDGTTVVSTSAATGGRSTTTLAAPTSTAAAEARLAPMGVDELAFLIEGPPTTATPTTADGSAGNGTDDGTGEGASTSGSTATPTTTGSGGAPVTTVAAAPAADPGSIYQGVLGSLGADEVIATPVVAPPAAAAGTQPLTGLPGQVPNRPAIVVKIDNSSRARPQSGLDVADIVVEEEVEGGVTRFAAIFHSTNAIVGPVRSGRTTDLGVLVGLGSPLLLYSGANDVTDALLLDRSAIQNRSAARSSGYWRNRSRRAPSNLYTDTAPHWASASGGAPPAHFAYRAAGAASPGEAVTGFAVAYRANRASWEWDGTAWLRSQGGRAHTAASGTRISAANVVVIETAKVDTGMVDSSGAEVPEFVFVGSGRATVFTDGRKLVGTWTRPTLGSVATLTSPDGSVIELTPGRTWIELIQADVGMLQ